MTQKNNGRRVRVWATRAAAAFIILAIGCIWFYYHRPLPQPVQKSLFPGVEYERIILSGPVIIHVVSIDLQTTGLEFLVTPPQPTTNSEGENFQLQGQTTSDYVKRYNLDLAINGDFFEPWHSDGPFDYYPHQGDGVNPFGIAASCGDVYSEGREKPSFYGDAPTVFISESNQISFARPENIYNALSGSHWLVKDGAVALKTRFRSQGDRHPRTVIGVDRTGAQMKWVIVDGRQPNYSTGMSLVELESFLLDNGFQNAINLDGGGSTILVQRLSRGKTQILSSPINHRIPGIERNVANHIGIRIRPTK